MPSGIVKGVLEREKRAMAVVMSGVKDLLARGYSASFFDNVPGCNFQIVFWKDMGSRIDSQRMIIPWTAMTTVLQSGPAKTRFNRIMQRLNRAGQEMRKFMTIMILASHKNLDEIDAAEAKECQPRADVTTPEPQEIAGGEDANSGREREEVK